MMNSFQLTRLTRLILAHRNDRWGRCCACLTSIDLDCGFIWIARTGGLIHHAFISPGVFCRIHGLIGMLDQDR